MAGKRTIEALKYHSLKYNCAVSVMLPFCDALGVDKRTAVRMLEGCGRGLGTKDGNCGALIGADCVIGLINSEGTLDKGPASKENTYEKTAAVYEAFKERCGSVFCDELKAISDKSCEKCIAVAVELAEKLLNEQNKA